eukprot:NODE_284_length_10808_cov_1.215613.p5 type:complete len:139 gc:universal NODE_284_length_10808_cov_1.215613:9399-8983(-)
MRVSSRNNCNFNVICNGNHMDENMLNCMNKVDKCESVSCRSSIDMACLLFGIQEQNQYFDETTGEIHSDALKTLVDNEECQVVNLGNEKGKYAKKTCESLVKLTNHFKMKSDKIGVYLIPRITLVLYFVRKLMFKMTD